MQREILKTIFDHIPLMINVIGADGMPIYVNRAWERTLGWTLEEATQQDSNFVAELYPDREARQRVLNFAAQSTGKWHDFKTKVRDGRIVDTTWAVVRLSDGTSIGIGQDITERKRTGDQLKDSFKEISDLKAALDEHAIVAITDPKGRITYVNDKFCAISKYSRAELLGQDHRLINSGHHSKEFIRCVWTAITHGKVWHGDIKNKAKDGSFYWVATTIVPILNAAGKPRHYVAIRADITERKRAEEESNHSREQLRALTARLESLREEERIRISREVHDELGQKLTGLKMDLLWSERRLGELELAPPLNPILERVVGMTEIVDGIIAAVQEIAARLRPGVLDKLGLGAAIQCEARRFQERTGIACEMKIPEQEPILSSEIATALFRIFQECLTNAVRHANATNVHTELKTGAVSVSLRVTDNGRGITEEELNSPQALGLLGMKERAALLGGEVTIERDVEKGGTVVTARIRQQAALPKEGDS